MHNAKLTDTVNKLKKRIIEIEAGNDDLSETDTRQGLINPLFRALGWDFSDFASIKSEIRILKFNEPVDYAFYSSKEKSGKPILLLEAKKLGTHLGHKDHVKQITSYLGGMGVQWGVLSDGNRYVLYNSRGGTSFDDQKFLVLDIKTVDTDSGFVMEEFVKHLVTLLSRESLENEEIQQAYETHMINAKIKVALDSLLSEPFETLVVAIRREFKEKRVGVPEGIRITKKHVQDFIQSISDESGRIPVDLEAEVIHTDDAVQENVAASGMGGEKRIRAHGKRVTIADLLAEGLVKEGDQWKLTSKGETTWGRVESNGQLEVNGTGYGNPSKAYMAVLGKPGNGWYYWHYGANDEYHRIDVLRGVYRERIERKTAPKIVSSGEPDSAVG